MKVVIAGYSNPLTRQDKRFIELPYTDTILQGTLTTIVSKGNGILTFTQTDWENGKNLYVDTIQFRADYSTDALTQYLLLEVNELLASGGTRKIIQKSYQRDSYRTLSNTILMDFISFPLIEISNNSTLQIICRNAASVTLSTFLVSIHGNI